MRTQPKRRMRRFIVTMRDELGGGSFRAGLAAMRRAGTDQQAAFPFHQPLVEIEQRCRLDQCGQFRSPAWAHEHGGQSEHHALEYGQVRSAMARATAYEHLMLQ
jgi:hypothetical protein